MKTYYYIIALFLLAACESGDEIIDSLDSTAYTTTTISNERMAARTIPYQTNHWMSSIDGNTYLKDLSLVGSHDAGAYRYGGGLAICQEDDIYTQLNQGIRYLDIRLNYEDGKLTLYHGIVSQKLDFEDDILSQIFRFLDENPSETLMMIVKNENGKDQENWEKVLMNVVDRNAARFNKFITLKTKLSELRGKISIITRSGLDQEVAKMRGIGYNSSTFGTLNNEPMFFADEFKVPNLFNSSIDKKAHSIYNAIEMARSPTYDNTWVIINCNGTSAFAYPNAVADRINPKVEAYLLDHRYVDNNPNTLAKRNGILVIDFSTSTKGKNIINEMINHSLMANQ